MDGRAALTDAATLFIPMSIVSATANYNRINVIQGRGPFPAQISGQGIQTNQCLTQFPLCANQRRVFILVSADVDQANDTGAGPYTRKKTCGTVFSVDTGTVRTFSMPAGILVTKWGRTAQTRDWTRNVLTSQPNTLFLPSKCTILALLALCGVWFGRYDVQGCFSKGHPKLCPNPRSQYLE